MNEILTWDDLNKFKVEDLDRVHGINNSYANLRLFEHSENDVLVTLYRDRHSWCPYSVSYTHLTLPTTPYV